MKNFTFLFWSVVVLFMIDVISQGDLQAKEKYNSSVMEVEIGGVNNSNEFNQNTAYGVPTLINVEESEEEFTGGGRVAPTGNSGSSVVAGTAPWGLSFDTTEDFTINSVDVFLTSSTPEDLVVQLLDENWQLIEETTVACPAGSTSNAVQFEVPLDFDVEADNTYRLVAVSSPTMIREFSDEHPGFPYAIGDVGSVTGGTIDNSDSNNTVYYFFYNWTVTVGDEEGC